MSKDNGGQAFPRPAGDYNGSRHGNGAQEGMTLRDYFAAKALQGLCAGLEYGDDVDAVPELCYMMADAMIAERNKQ